MNCCMRCGEVAMKNSKELFVESLCVGMFYKLDLHSDDRAFEKG